MPPKQQSQSARRAWRSAACVLVTLMLGASCAHIARAADDDAAFSLDDVMRAWTERQEQTRSLKIHWHTTEIQTKGSLFPERPENSKSPLPPGPVPETDIEIRFERSLLVDRGRMRFVERGQYWDDPNRKFGAGTSTTIWNGTEGREYSAILDNESATSPGKRIGGRITSEPTLANNSSAGPALLAVWPLDPELGNVNLQDYRLSGQTAVIDGRKSAMLQKVSGTTFWTEIWVDVEASFLILRALIRRDEVVGSQLDIAYQDEENRGWYPVHWTWHTLKRDGSLRTSASSEVVEYQPDPEIAAEDFRLDFPTASMFTDQRTPETKIYIARPDGTHREVLEQEIHSGISAETLMNTEPGEAWEERGISRRVLAAFAGILLLVVALVVAIWRR